MKSSSFFACAGTVLLAALLAGCDTPQSRIDRSPEIFARLNPDQQALVKKGQVGIGFDMDAVKLALGDPTRVVERTTPQGERQIWHYVTYEDYDGVIIYGGYYHHWRGWGGPYFYGGVPYYDGYPARVHDRFRVEFDSTGHVVAIDQEKP
ncbi:MAG TPA: hypothetical protein VGG34_06885 [Opitutaceae bacterium]|jgi:hypothetical protein